VAQKQSKGIMNNNLRPGVWLVMKPLPHDTTEQQLSDWLRAHALDIGPEYVSVNSGTRNCWAFVSVANDVVRNLVYWALNGDTFGGQPSMVVELTRAARASQERT
jgi:hypothetical protein